MYRVEMIPKKTTIDECLDYWIASGRKNETGNGQFVFESVDNVDVHEGTLQISKGGSAYIYNMADFYRIKIIDLDK